MSNRESFLRTKLFPKIVADGVFGVDAEYSGFELDTDSVVGDGFSSDILFGKVLMTNGQSHPVVMKFKHKNAKVASETNMHEKFYNEYVFYDQLLPELSRNTSSTSITDMFPKFWYSNASLDDRQKSEDEEQVIVLENMYPKGYQVPKERIFLDKDHVRLAMRKLGAFHGYSYASKSNSTRRQLFLQLLGQLVETEWFFGYWYRCPTFLSSTAYRGIETYVTEESRRGDYGASTDQLENICALLDGNSETMKTMVTPKEPFAVLCHGDFCRNNLLYKYDATGRPIDVLMFDVAQARYSSPAIDISFFLYLNTTEEDRQKYWDSYMAAYLDGMAEAFPELNLPDIEQEMQPYAFYGYAHCAFFLPGLVNPTPPDVAKLSQATIEECIEMIVESGGAKADYLLAAIIRHMIQRKYV
ncbi:uncharacterized protein LOC126910273 [Daktulosphaira vitifoliae]|uniref:uncharacterized protein LOC126910273 n=1 Tax=Daktulosphaira vitifoliae TaxID=58002 RepID=UPI0021AA8861|nr:uncharacterized protein LOC126910273 [Daktulosphaira vitifoliae]